MSYFKVVSEAAKSIGEFVGKAKPSQPSNETLKAIQTGLRNDGRPIPIIAGLAGVNAFALDTLATVISKPPSLADLQAVVPVLFPHRQLSADYKLVPATNTENFNAPPRSAPSVAIQQLSQQDENEMQYLKQKLGLRAYDHVARWDSARVWDAASLNAESQRVNREDERMSFRDASSGMVSTLHACQYWRLFCLRIDQSAGAERRAELIKRSIQVAGDLEAATLTGINLVRHAVVMHGTRPGVAFARDNTVRLATMLAQEAAVAAQFPNYQDVDDAQFRQCTMTAAHLRSAFEIIAKAVEGKHELVVSPKEAALVIMARVFLTESDAPVAPQVA